VGEPVCSLGLIAAAISLLSFPLLLLLQIDLHH
jgi:hypothetical protein